MTEINGNSANDQNYYIDPLLLRSRWHLTSFYMLWLRQLSGDKAHMKAVGVEVVCKLLGTIAVR
jgi:hypothetical protein